MKKSVIIRNLLISAAGVYLLYLCFQYGYNMGHNAPKISSEHLPRYEPSKIQLKQEKDKHKLETKISIPIRSVMQLPDNQPDQSKINFGLKPGVYDRSAIILTPLDAEKAKSRGISIKDIYGCEANQELHPYYRYMTMIRVDTTKYGNHTILYSPEHNFIDHSYTVGYLNGTGCTVLKKLSNDQSPDLIVLQNGYDFNTNGPYKNIMRLWFNGESPKQPTRPYVSDTQWQSDYTSKSIAPSNSGFYVRYNKPECLTPESEWDAIKNLNEDESTKALPKGFLQRKSAAYGLISNTDGPYVHNNRGKKVTELSEVYKIDIYGRSRQLRCKVENTCAHDLAQEYKFYLAWENSNCKEYMTEKLFTTAFIFGVIPIVMGAPKEDYLKLAPPHSFIHVDDFSNFTELAAYLKKIENDPKELGKYFAWKKYGYIVNALPFYLPMCVAIQDAKVRNEFPIMKTNAQKASDECQSF